MSKMNHSIIPMPVVMQLIVDPSQAFINDKNTYMVTLIGDDLHVLTGDFNGIDSGTPMEEIIRRNLQ